MKNKYMIRCDMEGASGVVSYKQVEPESSEYIFGKKMLMADLMALIKGLNEGGAEKIVVYDEHYYGRNLDIDKLPENVAVISGKPPYKKEWAGGLDDTFAGLILLGFHSKYGTKGGLLPHSYELDIKNIILNGKSVGEIGVEIAIAGDFNVPLLMITGDSAGINEAQKIVQGFLGIIVKEALCEGGAICYSANKTYSMIYNGAIDVVKNKIYLNNYSLGNNINMRIELNNGVFLNSFYKIYKDKMENKNSILLEGKSVTEVWSRYWAMKLNAQKEMGD